MHLRSITLKGFKSFPERTRLDFGPGISVVVGPNGSGKSNITDAVLWAMGEQSPLAVRGQSMQDVIFGGGRGVQARSAAEVELVIDNSDGALDLPMSEISIVRRLDRAGEGEYRLNGARCRLVDVLETLSDTGLGKEMHSVISQGRVEAIVTSRPRDRRLLIEEAAGLGKHRKRRRRAQLKLERTQDNLDRALDVEREARSRLRPLKRQSEAAELHERLERQHRQTRWELLREALRERRVELAAAESATRTAREALDGAERELAQVAAERERAERAMAERSRERDLLSRRLYTARSAAERLSMRAEQTRATGEGLVSRIAAREAELERLRAAELAEPGDQQGSTRVAALEAELADLERDRESELERELGDLRERGERAGAQAAELERSVAAARARVAEAEQALDGARATLHDSERAVEHARREAASVGAQLAAVNQFLRAHAGTEGAARALSGELEVAEGCELALAAVLGGRLGAAIVADRGTGSRLLDGAGPDGGRALVSRDTDAPSAQRPAPTPDAVALQDLIGGPEAVVAVARRLLEDAWLVEDLAAVGDDFSGVAVTRAGRAWFAGSGELRQVAEGGAERVLAERNRRERLIADAERAASAERAAHVGTERAAEGLRDAQSALEATQVSLRHATREHAAALEEHERLQWLAEQRRAAPDHGERAVRRAQVEGELAAERRGAARAERERLAQAMRLETLTRQLVADRALEPVCRRVLAACETAGATAASVVAALEAELRADSEAGEAIALELRGAATGEAEIQARLRELGESVTSAEVSSAQARDRDAETAAELTALAGALELEDVPAPAEMDPEQRASLLARSERLERRREQLGPVNPLAQDEYREALEHVEELEAQRTDLETALRELRTLITDIDREIKETFEQTFEAAARNFEELVGDVFPGGRGRLRLVSEEAGPRAVLGGGEDPDPAEAVPADELLGVEIEVTPAGKSMRRLSLLSGGEKSMTAIAFLFAVFLARPCPFYILDEVEAALDDLNTSRFLDLLRRHSGRAQFIVVTHQKRTMEAADCLYGVSMGDDGVSKVISRRLPPEVADDVTAGEAGVAA